MVESFYFLFIRHFECRFFVTLCHICSVFYVSHSFILEPFLFPVMLLNISNVFNLSPYSIPIAFIIQMWQDF